MTSRTPGSHEAEWIGQMDCQTDLMREMQLIESDALVSNNGLTKLAGLLAGHRFLSCQQHCPLIQLNHESQENVQHECLCSLSQ